MNFFNFSAHGGMAELMQLVVLGFMIVTVVIHVFFAIGVLAAASSRRQGTHYVPGAIWGLATLLGGVFVAAAYWFTHDSTLSPKNAPQGSSPPPVADL